MFQHFCSECNSEWFDCIGEDETYLREKESFYENCSAITKDSEVPIELLEITKDRCFENRKCNPNMTTDADGLIVGNSDQCTCANLVITPNGPLPQRYKRQTAEIYISRSNSQRVFKAGLGLVFFSESWYIVPVFNHIIF